MGFLFVKLVADIQGYKMLKGNTNFDVDITLPPSICITLRRRNIGKKNK